MPDQSWTLGGDDINSLGLSQVGSIDGINNYGDGTTSPDLSSVLSQTLGFGSALLSGLLSNGAYTVTPTATMTAQGTSAINAKSLLLIGAVLLGGYLLLRK
jgi:hypothetical protein